MNQKKPPKYIWIVFVEDSVWGVFSSEKKAHKALTAWKQSPATFGQIRVYQLNYRILNAPPRYVSDPVLPNMGGDSTTDIGSLVSGNNVYGDPDPAT